MWTMNIEIANRLVKRVSDFALVKYDGVINETVANDSLDIFRECLL